MKMISTPWLRMSLVLVLALGLTPAVQGQRRSDLLVEIDTLKARLGKTETALSQAKKEQKASQAMAEPAMTNMRTKTRKKTPVIAKDRC